MYIGTCYAQGHKFMLDDDPTLHGVIHHSITPCMDLHNKMVTEYLEKGLYFDSLFIFKILGSRVEAVLRCDIQPPDDVVLFIIQYCHAYYKVHQQYPESITLLEREYPYSVYGKLLNPFQRFKIEH